MYYNYFPNFDGSSHLNNGAGQGNRLREDLGRSGVIGERINSVYTMRL